MSTTQPPAVPDGLSQKEQRAFLERHGQAHNIQHKSTGAYLFGSASKALGNHLPPEAFDQHVQNVLAESGNPADPIERMLIGQLVLANHNIGRLHLRAAQAENLDQANVYSTAATRLLAEFRRCTLALKKYREPSGPKNVTFVGQQNVAEEQQVAYVDGQPHGVPSQKGPTSQLSKEIPYVPPTDFFTQSQACRGWEKEPAKARSANGRWPREAATNGVGKPALGEVNGAAHR